MEGLQEVIQNRDNLFITDLKAKNRDKVVSIRVSEGLKVRLEEQSRFWDLSLSDTVRQLIEYFFLPSMIEEVWKHKTETLIKQDEEMRGDIRAKLDAKTQAEKIEPVLVDAYEAKKYADFAFQLIELELDYFERMRKEAITMGTIASKQLRESAERLREIQKILPRREEMEHEHEKDEQRLVSV